MLCYLLKRPDYSLDIYMDHSVINIDSTIQKYLNKRLEQNLTTIKSREKVTKKILHIKAKVPLFINDDELLMCIKSYRLEQSFYINYFSIKYFHEENNNIIIDFIPNYSLKIRQKYSFYQQLKRCKQILEYLNF